MQSEELAQKASAGPAQTEHTQFSGNALFDRVGLAGQLFPSATLFVVGMPIGNAADITLRALWVLDLADAVACEDTRTSRVLLDRYGIRTPTISVHEHNEAKASEALIERLRKGERIALITDAGTPAVSDPGALAVQKVREAGFRVMPVPGASACVTAMSGSGLDSYTFTFVGFVPPNAKAREAALAKYAAREDAFILYEAPHRLKSLLEDLSKVLDPTRRVVVVRELTKRFETFEAMKGSELAEFAATHEPRGEYAILVDEAKRTDKETLSEEAMQWARAIATELPLSKTAALVARVTGVKRDVAYNALMREKAKAE